LTPRILAHRVTFAGLREGERKKKKGGGNRPFWRGEGKGEKSREERRSCLPIYLYPTRSRGLKEKGRKEEGSQRAPSSTSILFIYFASRKERGERKERGISDFSSSLEPLRSRRGRKKK